MSTNTNQCLPGRRLSLDGDANRKMCVALSAATASEPTGQGGFSIRRRSESQLKASAVYSGISAWNDDTEYNEKVCTSTNDMVKGFFGLGGGKDETTPMRRSSSCSQAELQMKTKKLVGCEKLWGDFRSELKQCDFKTDMGTRDLLEKFVAEKMTHDDRGCSKEGGAHLPPPSLLRRMSPFGRNFGRDESQGQETKAVVSNGLAHSKSAPSFASNLQQRLSRLDNEREIRNSSSASGLGYFSRRRSTLPSGINAFHTRRNNPCLAQDSKSYRKVESRRHSSPIIPMSSMHEERGSTLPSGVNAFHTRRNNPCLAQDSKSYRKVASRRHSSLIIPMSSMREERGTLARRYPARSPSLNLSYMDPDEAVLDKIIAQPTSGDDSGVQSLLTLFTEIAADQKSRKKKSDHNMSPSTYPPEEIKVVPQHQQESIACEGAGKSTIRVPKKPSGRHRGREGLDRRESNSSTKSFESQSIKSDESNFSSSFASAGSTLLVEWGDTTDDFSDDEESSIEYNN